MSTKEDRIKYADCMTFIRYRLEVINLFLNRKITTGYDIPDIETIALQFRKVFELIAMASLCSNREKFEEVRARFDKMWNAAEIIKMVEKFNPNFYPKPIERKFNKDPSTGGTISPLLEGFLTKEELIKAIGRCGDLLHADNPYSENEFINEKWFNRFRDWNSKTHNLLKLHTIQVLNYDIQWWAVMKFGTNEPVQIAEMQKITNG
ncbi:hypothetical protein [Sedimenticola sp.]|uniref:hypothetical protein n=1 Tax=Sedimenticola sp. TaxID=1940285 RepID=UPI003D0D7284